LGNTHAHTHIYLPDIWASKMQSLFSHVIAFEQKLNQNMSFLIKGMTIFSNSNAILLIASWDLQTWFLLQQWNWCEQAFSLN